MIGLEVDKMNHNQKILNHLQEQQDNDKPIMYILLNGSKPLTVNQRINQIKDVLIRYMDDISLNELLLKRGGYFSSKQRKQIETKLHAYSLWRKVGQPIKELTIPSESYQHIINRYKIRRDRYGRLVDTDPKERLESTDHLDILNQLDSGIHLNQSQDNFTESIYQDDLELTNQLISFLTNSNIITNEDIFMSLDQLSFGIKPITKSQFNQY